MIIDRIREEMSVIALDDRCIGFVSRLEGDAVLRITCISAGYGYDRLIPLSWVSAVDKFVYLDRTSGYVAGNWEKAPVLPRKAAPSERRTPAASVGFATLRSKAA
ncbi:MAG: DUF2171 domain-containing protein [Propylenella sp.]